MRHPRSTQTIKIIQLRSVRMEAFNLNFRNIIFLSKNVKQIFVRSKANERTLFTFFKLIIDAKVSVQKLQKCPRTIHRMTEYQNYGVTRFGEIWQKFRSHWQLC